TTPTVVCSPLSGSTFAAGTTSVTCTSANACGSSSCSFSVTINQSPLIGACPSDIVQCDNHVATFSTPSSTGTPAATVTCSPVSGSTFNTGTTAVTCTATNSCGSSSCSFNVTINESPVIGTVSNASVVGISPFSNIINVDDAVTWTQTSSAVLTMAGFTITAGNSIVRNPANGL